MYSKLKQCIAASCAFLLASSLMIEAKAAVASDKTEAATSEESLNPGTIDLDVPAYLVRYLYREPDADSLQMKKWYKGWGMMLYWNPDFLPFQSNYSDKMANRLGMSSTGVGFAIQKDINKIGAIRLGANMSTVDVMAGTTDGATKSLKRFNVSLDYLWNLSSTYYGYDLHRPDEWLLTIGVKGGRLFGGYEKSEGSHSDYIGSVNMGLQYRKNIANDMSFFIEPQFAFFSDKYDGKTSFYEVDPGLNLLVGLYFRLGQPKMQILESENEILQNLFFQAYGGQAMGKETFAFTSMTKNDYNKSHMNFGFNVGSWLNPSLAVRLGYFENIMGIGRSDSRIAAGLAPTSRQTYRGGRVEFVLNPLTIMTNKPSLGRFGWDVSVGYEAGVINKHTSAYNNKWTDAEYNKNNTGKDNGNHVNYFAHGVTFGTQLKYYMSKNYAFFLDARYSNPGYSADAQDGLTSTGDLSEKVLSWAVGMEYYISTFNRYSRFKKFDNHESREIERLRNKNRWYTEVAAGIGEPTHWGENFKARRAMLGDVALGVNYNDLHGLRMRASLTRKYFRNAYVPSVTNAIPGDTYTVGFGLDYMLNLTNLWMGTEDNDYRWSDIYLFAGPTMRIATHDLRKSFTSRNVFGLEVGAQFTRRVSRSVELFLEPRYEYNVHESNDQLKPFQAGNRWDLMAGIKMYQWREKNYHYRDSIAGHDRRSWFMEIGGGAGFDVTGNSATLQERMKALDGDLRLSFGYRVNPISSLRAHFDYTQFAWGFGKSYSGNVNGEKGFEVGFDYMANVLNLWYGNNPHRIFQLQGYAGAIINPDGMFDTSCTEDIAYDWRFGVEAGAQLIIAPFNNVSFYIEPRATYYLSDYITKRGSELLEKSRDEHFDVYAGIILYNQPEHLEFRGYKPTDADTARFWYYEMAGGLNLTPSGSDKVMNSLAPGAYLGLGHYLNGVSSVRLRLAMAKFNKSESMGYKDKMSTGIGIDYMYNLTNKMMGINPYRRFDFSLYAGPHMEFRNSEVSEDDRWLLAINLGGQLAWHVNNYMDVFAEGRAVFPAKRMNADSDNATRLGHTRYEALAGLKLYQNKSKAAQYSDSLSQHGNTWFMEVAGGAGKELKVGNNATMAAQDKLDGTGKIAVGYRFNPISSLRLSGLGWASNKRYTHGDLSFDYMADLMNLWYGVNPYRRVNLRGYFGPVLRFDNMVDPKINTALDFGFDAGIQMTVGLTDNIDLLLEPRYFGLLTGDNKNTGRGDIYAGLIFYNQPGLLAAREYPTVNLDNERGWYMEAAGGVSFAPDGRRSGITKHFDPTLNMAIGRYFTNYSSVRARGSLTYVNDHKTMKEGREWVPEVSLDYIHNITNHLLGVNPYRRWDYSLFAGPIAQIGGFNSGNFSANWGVNFGSDVAWHMNNFVDLFVEPRISYLMNDECYTRFETLAGVRLYQNNTNNMQYAGSDAPHANTWFMETSGGTGALVTDVLNGENLDFTLKGALGYRFNPYSSVRFGAAAWTRKNDNGTRTRAAEVFGDYMINVQNLLYGVNPYRQFNLRAFVGGLASPKSFLTTQQDVTWSLGFDLGLQGTYKLTDNIDLMVEPRLESYLNNGATQRFDVYAGLIWYNRRGMMLEKGYNPTNIDDKNTWFLETGGGFSYSPDGRIGGGVLNHIDYDGFLSLGVHLNNFSSLRGRGDFMIVRNPETTKDHASYHPLVSLDYMYNVTNAIMGVNPYRRFDINLFAGPVARIYGLRSGIDFKQTMKLNVEGGAQASWHINSKWDLFGEGTLLLGNKISSRLNAHAGVAYRFNKLAMSTGNSELLSDKLFAQVLMGGQLINVEGRTTISSVQSLPSINYNIGYHVNNMVNLQAGVFSNHLSANAKSDKKLNAYQYGVRGEVGVNLLNMFNPSYDANEKRFQWTVSAGAQLGRTRNDDLSRANARFSLTGASQLQYRVFSHSWAIAELRAQTLDANGSVSIPLTAQIGMMYDFNKGENNPMSASNIYVQGGVGSFESNVAGYEFGIGYDLTPVHGLRLIYDASTGDIDQLGSWRSLSPDYVCNLTNLFLGHDDNKRHVDLSFLIGADLSFLEVNGESKNSFGANAGLQLTYNINKNWAIYTEPRFSYSGSDNTKHSGLDLQTTVGLKYRLPKFGKE